MRKALKAIYYFLPVQLLLLHFRKYQLLMLFWFILLFTLTGHFASHFGASSLFLAPEYLGEINYASMFLLGCAMCVFIMMWHITTFIIHSKRMPYLSVTRHSFLVYCTNNSVVPLAFLVFYSVVTIRFQFFEQHTPVRNIILLQLGFYLGLLVIMLVSFTYFFRISRDFLKTTIARLTTPVQNITTIIPFDSLDEIINPLPAETYISVRFRVDAIDDTRNFHPRMMRTVLQRHHRNVIFATFIAYAILLVMGIYIDNPYLRVPAGASFLLLFSIFMGLVGAFKYFLKSWEALGWVVFMLLFSAMVRYKFFDLRSIAYGLDYHKQQEQPYNYGVLRSLFSPLRYDNDKQGEMKRLASWKGRVAADSSKPPLVVVSVSGGGLRSAYWTFRSLQYADSLSGGKLFRNTVLITGASGGMIGASYWRNVHDAYQMDSLKVPYSPAYQDNIGKDLLNAIVFSFASVDMISPFNKITTAGHTYTTDRGYAMEREMAENTEGLLDKPIRYFGPREAAGQIPMLIVNGTIVNDGRKLMVCTQPIAYLTQPEYSLGVPNPPIDAVDLCAFFPEQNAQDLLLTSALRMNATFPYILPVVRLPSQPRMNIMDAGLRDNFGIQLVTRYLHTMRKWLDSNTSKVIFLEIRDTQENDISSNNDQTSLGNMIADPLFVIQNKWEAFQSYGYTYLKDYVPTTYDGRFRFITLQYVPKDHKKTAALNFHLTQKEKEDIYNSIDHPHNQLAIKALMEALK